MDLLWKIQSRPHWSATLRSNPSIVVTADDGDKLADLATKFTIALLQSSRNESGHGHEHVGRVADAIPGPHGLHRSVA
jgi:hypothetical protein